MKTLVAALALSAVLFSAAAAFADERDIRPQDEPGTFVDYEPAQQEQVTPAPEPQQPQLTPAPEPWDQIRPEVQN